MLKSPLTSVLNQILKRFVFFTTYLCLDKVQWGTGHEISDLCDGIQFSFFSFQRTKVTKKYWPQLWVPQWSWFQTVSKAGKLGNQFEYISSSDKLFASMRNNEELDMIFQTDMTSYEWAHFSLYDNGAKGTKKKKSGKNYIFVVLFFNNRQFITHDDENSAILFPPKYQFAILFCSVCDYFSRPPKNVFSIYSFNIRWKVSAQNIGHRAVMGLFWYWHFIFCKDSMNAF